MSTKSGRRSSIRELKPGASKKRGRRIETKTVAEAAVATEVLEAEAPEDGAPEPAEAEPSDAQEGAPAPPEPTDEAMASEDGAEAAAQDDVEPTSGEAAPDALADGERGEEEPSDDEDDSPTPIEAAMLDELTEGVSDNTEAFLEGLIEALLFSSDRPMPAKELARAAGIDRRRAEELVAGLKRRYATGGLTVEEVAGGYVMRSSPRYASYIQKLLALRPVRLSRAQLETLAIVAYRQPVTKPEVDDIRGVDSGQVLKGLLERELLKIVGKKDEPGRPMLYGTTTAFLELLNLQSLKDLPTLREYTELSEESRRKFAEETGESPEAPTEEAAVGEGEAAADAPLEAAATSEGEGEARSEDGDTERETMLDGEATSLDREAPASGGDSDAPADDPATDDVATDDPATDDVAADGSEPDGAADEPRAVATQAPADDAEDGIDLDVLGEAGDIDDEADAPR